MNSSYRITAQGPDGTVHEVKVAAPDLRAAFITASRWADATADPGSQVRIIRVDAGWTWQCPRCAAEGLTYTDPDSAAADAARYHRACQEG